jgi:predicted transcriptional regulator
MLSKTQVKVILILLDDKGHAGRELTKCLKEKKAKSESNINPILKNLERMGIIYQGEPRVSRNQQEKIGDYKEFPYYLCKSLEAFKILIREIAETRRPYDTGFLLEIIDNSKYLRSMKWQFKEDLNVIINEELSKSDSPYSDPFFTKVIEPELEEKLFCNLERLFESEIQA